MKLNDVIVSILIKIYDEDYTNNDELTLYLVDIVKITQISFKKQLFQCLKKKEIFYDELEYDFINVLKIPIFIEKFNIYFEYYIEDSIDEFYNLFSTFSAFDNIVN